MKLFYLTVLDELDREKCGILGKIRGQISSFQKADINVYFGHFHGQDKFIIENNQSNESLFAGTGDTRTRLGAIYDALFQFIVNNNISTIYIRFTSLDKKAISFYKKLKNIGITVIIEFYSHNLELEARKTIIRNFKNHHFIKVAKGSVSLLLNKQCFRELKDCVDLIVTTTKVGNMYGVPTINVINGIDTSAVRVRKKKENGFDLNIISVAMISPWHGYDRVITGIYEYYKKGGQLDILYTVIGEGEEKKNLEEMVKDLNLQKHVIFTGIKTGEELSHYYDQADIALEILAGFRRTEGQISSIKMAEYFSKGIPVLYASETELYSEETAKFCFRVNNNNESINIEDIIKYCNKLYSQNNDIEERMHAIAKEQFDWTTTMRELLNFIQK